MQKRSSLVLASLAMVSLAMLTSACQVTSGQLRTKEVPCDRVERESDIPGYKPQWNLFGKVEAVQHCRQSTSSEHQLKLSNGFGVSQFTRGDDVVFREITERVFREILAANGEFMPIAESTTVIDLPNGTRRTFYALKRNYKRPSVLFAMNDGYPNISSGTWSQFHLGYIKAETPMSLDEFETWFVQTVRAFKYEGGDYASAFK